ncbi:helix-turn-helix domain-containing protein [Scatolibacter rhodanostii]|uniref:helix-turn-helix domain-containing protein n=1 Tax=Scatolibacter rhodanostii TaxID=2014781 RepID=UPI0013565A67|nr:AraC family transcriptional regulator [Scatolibacter rhodanostii]
MALTDKERKLYGDNVQILKKTEVYTQYRLSDEVGEGIMTAYEVFPGIRLIYNDMRMNACGENVMPMSNFIEVNHCREGQIELLLDSDEHLYLTKGDLSVNIKDGSCHSSCFPLGYYYGTSIEINMDEAPKCLSCILDDVYIDFEKLWKVLKSSDSCIIMRNIPSFEHIFSELYSISDDMRLGYYKIKVLEILFFLCGMDIDSATSVKKRYSKLQEQKVRAIKEYVDVNWQEHITLCDLSAQFAIPLTSMKKCFHGIYDIGIYAYLRNIRMQKAAVLLVQTDETVLSIAGQVGYDNASKFSSAFKTVIGQLPTEYRRNEKEHDQMEQSKAF